MFSIDLKKGVRMRDTIAELANRFPGRAERALEKEMDIEMEESKKRTPYKSGDLKKSHKRLPAKLTGKQITCSIIVTAPYAVIQHETTWFHHRIGQAKFLESTLYESRPFMGERLARRLHFVHGTEK